MNVMEHSQTYTDEQVPRGFEVMTAMWDNGFGQDALFQVSRPLAHLPERKLVLLGGAKGVPLGDMLRARTNPTC